LLKNFFDPYIVLDLEKHNLSSKGHLSKQNFLLFVVHLRKTEPTSVVLSFKIKFSSKIDPPYSVMGGGADLKEK
jgi:hypothetical protein